MSEISLSRQKAPALVELIERKAAWHLAQVSAPSTSGQLTPMRRGQNATLANNNGSMMGADSKSRESKTNP